MHSGTRNLGGELGLSAIRLSLMFCDKQLTDGGSPAPRWFCGVVGVVWLLCSGGWSAAQAGQHSQVVLWGLEIFW